MARTARVIFTPKFLVDFFKTGRNVYVVAGQPEDAELVDVMYDLANDRFELVCSSGEFEEHSAEEAPIVEAQFKAEG